MLENINSVVCGIALPLAIFGVGIFFLFKLRFFYIIHPVLTTKRIFSASGGFRPLCVALAGTLGVGNIVGVSSAIIMGGAGSVFWMLLSALVAMGVKYAESFLAVKHRRGNINHYYGGAPYYISDACGGGKTGKFFGGIFALLCVLNSLSTGNLVQVNSVSGFIPRHRLIFGIIFALAVFLIVLGNEKRIQAVSSVLIPILTVSYLFISLYIIFSNLGGLRVAISRIFDEAFSFKSAVSGACGFGIASAIRFGFSRGLLSNEAGCGTSPVAHASSNLDAHSQGCLGIFEVFWDTVILCTLTALVILIADIDSDSAVMLAINSYGSFTGVFGEVFIVTSLTLFALATVSCQYYYGSKCLDFLSTSKHARRAYSLIFFFVCAISAIISNDVMWRISDFIIAFLALYNLVFLIVLSKEVKSS